MKRIIFLSAFIFSAILVVFAKKQTSLNDSNIPEPKTIELPNKVKLEYAEQGDANGTPVIFLHGLSDSWHSYERVFPHLHPSIHAYAISLRGHGDSDRPESGYDPANFAADVAAFMKKLKIKSAVIVGHSMSSTITQRFALDYPNLTKAVVLIGTMATYANNPGVVEFNKQVAALTDPVDPAFAKEFQVSTIAQPIPAPYLDTVINESLKLPARVWKAAINGLMNSDYTKSLAQLKKPALIIWGAKDTFAPEADQHKLNSVISKSKLLVYQNAGHAVHWEEPKQFVKDLYSFVQSVK